MKYTIKEGAQDVAISVENVKPDQQGKVLEALQECAEGRCSCPTQQYQKVETLDIARKADAIEIDLRVKRGQKIDREDIEKCLAYTIEKAGG
jgi:hypothetical protein